MADILRQVKVSGEPTNELVHCALDWTSWELRGSRSFPNLLQMVRVDLSLSLLLSAVASSASAVNTSALNGWYACNDLTFSDEGSVSDSTNAECAIYNAPLCHTGICDDSNDQTVSVFFKRILASTNVSSAPNVWFLQGGPGASSTASTCLCR